MKATITFDLPDERQEHLDALTGTAWRCVVDQLDAYLRSVEKYGNDKSEAAFAAKIRAKMNEAINADGLILRE